MIINKFLFFLLGTIKHPSQGGCNNAECAPGLQSVEYSSRVDCNAESAHQDFNPMKNPRKVTAAAAHNHPPKRQRAIVISTVASML